MKNFFKNTTAALLLFTLTFFAADYSFAKSHKKTAVHKSSKKAHGKKKPSATHKSAKKSKVAGVSKKKKNRQIASADGAQWARSGEKKSKPKRAKVGSKYSH